MSCGIDFSVEPLALLIDIITGLKKHDTRDTCSISGKVVRGQCVIRVDTVNGFRAEFLVVNCDTYVRAVKLISAVVN